jgi:hypothetical protein
MTLAAKLDRAALPQFRAFERKRVNDLITAGMPLMKARDFARRETQGRARASLIHGVDQALAADLEIIEDPKTPDVRFRLVYLPLT